MNRLPWFRVHHRLIHDGKLKMLAFEDRWHFVALMCLKASGDLDDTDFTFRKRQAAIGLGLTVMEFDEVARRLQAVKLIDEELWPVKWEEIQCRSDNSAERVRKHRAKKKEAEKQAPKRVKRNGNVTVTVQSKKEKEKENISPNGDCASSDALKPAHIFEKWNEVAGRIGKPQVRDITPSRRQLLNARIKQYSIKDFVAVFAKVEASAFLRGDRKWKGCTFDWCMKRENFQKILEGNYDD